MECSDNIYLNDFDKLVLEANQKLSQYCYTNKSSQHLINKSIITNKTQNSTLTESNMPSPPLQFKNTKPTGIAGSMNSAAKPASATFQPGTSSKLNDRNESANKREYVNTNCNPGHNNLQPSDSFSSIAAAYSLPSLSETTSSDSFAQGATPAENNKASKLTNVRMDKHVNLKKLKI